MTRKKNAAPPELRVPSFDLTRQAAALKKELLECFERVLLSGRYILGPEVDQFEKEIASLLGVRHAVSVASGTDALWLALKALEAGPGDRVLTAPFTFFATAAAIVNAGAEPVFVDIDPITYNVNPRLVAEMLAGRSSLHERLGIDPETIKAIIPVHLFGQAADMRPLLQAAAEKGLAVIEDAAQAIGAEYHGKKAGSLGRLGCFSFFPSKNLGGLGDGGLITTDDRELDSRIRCLRVHGASRKYIHDRVGTNSRLDALQAALLRLRLQHLESWTDQRRVHAQQYTEQLRHLDWISTPRTEPERKHVYNQYTIRVMQGRRDALRDFLSRRGIETTVYYPLPLHLQTALGSLGYGENSFPEAERASREVLSLPLFPELTAEEIEWVGQSIQDFGKT